MAAVSALSRGRPITRFDLEDMPDDGHRYELIDGTLFVSPSPVPIHQRAVLRVAHTLEADRPAHLRVFIAPLDVFISDITVLVPDVLVAKQEAFNQRGLVGAPLLAVEVLSPSTRKIDLTLKKAMYEACGAASYWIVDPEAPSVTTWRLVDGGYVQSGSAAGEDVLEVEDPYPVRLVPVDLVADN